MAIGSGDARPIVKSFTRIERGMRTGPTKPRCHTAASENTSPANRLNVHMNSEAEKAIRQKQRRRIGVDGQRERRAARGKAPSGTRQVRFGGIRA